MRFEDIHYTRVKLCDVCDIVGGCAIDSKDMRSSGKYQVIKMGNLYNGMLDLNRNPSFINEIQQNAKNYILKYGDIVLTLTGTQGKRDYGFSAIISENKNLILNQRCALLRTNLKCYDKYLYYFLKTSLFLNQFFTSSIGGTGNQTNVSIKALNNFNICLPTKDEQIKIGDFLFLIDQRIDTQSKIIEDLESKIEWIRNEIFKKNYKSFNHSLSDYLSEYTERNVNNFYTPVAVGKYGIRKREEIYSKELAADYSKNKVIRQNTLIIGMGSTQIDIGILLIDENYCVSPAYTTYKIKNINASYLNELLIFLNPLLSKKYMIISSRQGKSVNKDELLAHKIFVHTNEIQIKIAELFHFLYAKIKKEKDILELYKKQKAYLLKNMFI